MDRTLFQIGKVSLAAAILCALSTKTLCAAIIHFKPNAVISSKVVTLGDVANVLDADASTIDSLNKIVIAPAPGAGGQTRLEFADIRSRLQATGVNLSETEFRGASSIVVQVAGGNSFERGRTNGTALKLQRERTEKLLSEVIRASFAKIDSASAALAVAAKVEDKDVALLLPALVNSQVEVSGADPRNTEEQTIAVHYNDRRGNHLETKARCRVSPHPQILAARYTIPAGHILREVDVVWRQAESADGVVIRLEDALNRETKRIIRQAEPIRTSDIHAVPLVRANDIVTVVSRRGRVAIRSEMKARTEGSLGETVTLASLKGQDAILARVTGLHEAEVITADAQPADTLQDATGRIEFRGEKNP